VAASLPISQFSARNAMTSTRVITYADAVIELAQQTRSGVILRKLTGLQPYLASFLKDARAHDLGQRITALTGHPATK
jgi:hypothetical protein